MNNSILINIKNAFVHQHDNSDCGVACLLSVIKYYGGENSFEVIRELSGTNQIGTTLLGLYQAANQLGFNAEGCEADVDSLIKHKHPVILHVIQNKVDEHYVVCYAYNGKDFIIGNPANGIEYWTIEYLESVWLSKSCLTLIPNELFEKNSTVRKAKKIWLINLFKEDINILIVSIFIGVFIAGLGMTMAVFSQKLIDVILPSKDYSRLWIGIGLLVILLSGRIGMLALRQYLLLRQGKDLNNRIIYLFYNNLLCLPKSFFDTRKIGDIVARLNDTRRIQTVISRIIGEVVIDALVAIVSSIFLFIYSYQLAIIAFIALVPLFLIIFKTNKKIISAQYEAMSGYALSESNFINTIQGISTIKYFNKQSAFSQINKNIYEIFQHKVFNLGLINIKLGWISGLFTIFFISSVLVYGVLLVLNDQMKLGELMAVLTISGSLLPSIVSLALVTISLNEAKVAFERMFEFINIKSENNGINTEDNFEFESLEVRNMSFRFPGKSRLLIDLSLTIHKGEIVSVIGESGCGKTTLCQIISKFYNFESGEILINNELSLNDIGMNKWRDTLGVVSQDIFIFNGSVLGNIAFDEYITNPNSVIEFCELYGFNNYFKRLPQGYNTIVGEDGINLSGGQKQLIAFARAIFKKPKILILDESTSSMDRDTEKFVTSLLAQLKKEMAILFISHRLHILRKICNRIYILNNARITISGDHHDLMQSNNIYKEYWSDYLVE